MIDNPAHQAAAMDAAARYHKAQVAHHRRQARECRIKQAEFEARCRELGISIEYNREGTFHGGPPTKSGHENPTINHD